MAKQIKSMRGLRNHIERTGLFGERAETVIARMGARKLFKLLRSVGIAENIRVATRE